MTSPLIGTGLSHYDAGRDGLPVVYAPARDFWNRPRRNPTSLGAFEYYGDLEMLLAPTPPTDLEIR